MVETVPGACINRHGNHCSYNVDEVIRSNAVKTSVNEFKGSRVLYFDSAPVLR